MDNKAKFLATLTECYFDLYANDPEYAYSKAHITEQALAVKMTNGLAAGSANKDGAGIKRACKMLNIKYTYAAIRAYLSGEPALHWAAKLAA